MKIWRAISDAINMFIFAVLLAIALRRFIITRKAIEEMSKRSSLLVEEMAALQGKFGNASKKE